MNGDGRHEEIHPEAVWMQVRSVEVDRTTRMVGVILARLVDGDLLFLPVEQTDADVIASARRACSADPALGVLVRAIAGFGTRPTYVVLELEALHSGPGHARMRSAQVVLDDGSTLRCDPAKALALSVRVGVPVRSARPVAPSWFVPAEQPQLLPAHA